MTETGTLYVVGTPLGNRDDITLRALKTLANAEVIMCEDTRVTSRLLGLYDDALWQALGGKPKKAHLARLDEAYESRMIAKVIDWLETGTSVSMVTDAGMPTISDPGWRVVDAVREAGFLVEVIPGPTALTTALATVGMDTSKVWFVGFLPKKPGKRASLLEEARRQLDAGISSVVVFYESPNRLRSVLGELTGPVAVCGELTKTHERVIRGTVAEVLEKLPLEIKGEWVVVLGS